LAEGMSTAAKIIITLAVSFVLMAGATVGVIVLLFSRYSGDVAEASRRNVEQGEAFGRDTDEAGCLAEAITRYKANSGLTGSLAIGMFEQACFRVSRPSPGFCDGVPSPLDVLRAGRWQRDQSQRAGIGADPFGAQVFAQVQAYCGSGVRQRRDGGPGGAEDDRKPPGD